MLKHVIRAELLSCDTWALKDPREYSCQKRS